MTRVIETNWAGGARVAVLDEAGSLLMVSQIHEGREIWLLPGGAIENDETSMEAAAREVLEETGLTVEILDLIWHVEEASIRGQRFSNYYVAKILGGKLCLGKDPELNDNNQILRQIRFVTEEELCQLPNVHPPFLKEEIWDILKEYFEKGSMSHKIFRKREYTKL